MKHHRFLLLLLGAGATLLVGCAGAAPSARAPTPTATLDATTQVYLTVLRTYYVPWVQDLLDLRDETCNYRFLQLTAAQQTQKLPMCRPGVVTEIAAGTTVIAQLAMAQPPARWQTAHAELKQAMQAAEAFDVQRLQAIDAHSVSRYVSLVSGIPDVGQRFCNPISVFNAELVSRHADLLPEFPETCG
jgi:hypothetical protein